MEKQPSYVLMLSLKEMVLRRIVVIFLNRPNFMKIIQKFPFQVTLSPSPWLGMEIVQIMFNYRMPKLLLPESLTRQLLTIVKAICTDIFKWKALHMEFLKDTNGKIGVPILEKLCWTSAGTVDYRKTADALIHSDVVDILKRFELTCLYCLEDYIPMIWKEMPKSKKRIICKGKVTSPHLQLFLPYILKKQSKHPIYRTVVPSEFLKHFTFYGNKTAVEYCLKNLPFEDREATLFQTAVDVLRDHHLKMLFMLKPLEAKLSDGLSYLLSVMTPEEQMRIFRELPCEVLKCFLDWPWQNLFLDIADIIWTFLPESKYKDLLFEITMHTVNSGYYIPKFLQEFFLRSPRGFRKFFVSQYDHSELFFSRFFSAKDTETIKVIFRSIEADDRVSLIFSKHFIELLNKELLENSWSIVEVCIREASLSKEERDRLGMALVEFPTRCDSTLKFEERKRFFEFLDGIDAGSAGKRSLEDEDVTPAEVKKACTG